MVCFPLHIANRPPSILLIQGVRSHEAKKIMKEKMKSGDKVRPAEFALTERLEVDANDRFCSIIAIPKNLVRSLP